MCGSKYFIIHLIISTYYFHVIDSKKQLAFDVTFTHANSYYNPHFFDMFKIIIKPSIPGPILDVDMKIIRNFSESQSPVTFFNILKKDANTNYRSLFMFTFNYCDMFGTSEKSQSKLNVHVENIVRPWVETVKKYSNLPNCPLVVGDYSIKNLRVDKKILPAFIVSGLYRIDFQNYLKNQQTKLVLRNASITFIIKKRK